MNQKVKSVLWMLVTSAVTSIVGFSCYRSGYNEGVADTHTMYEELVEFRSNEVPDMFEFSIENLETLLQKLNVKFPEIVMAQARLETGNFTSRIYNENNNLFGMKKAYRRPSTCQGLKYGHCYYDDWIDSVIDYVLYQRVFLSHVNDPDIYLAILNRSYAEDPKYSKKLQIIMQAYN